ncbi:hypothetical protein QU39_00175, partial [Staphylococcus aureus]
FRHGVRVSGSVRDRTTSDRQSGSRSHRARTSLQQYWKSGELQIAKLNPGAIFTIYLDLHVLAVCRHGKCEQQRLPGGAELAFRAQEDVARGHGHSRAEPREICSNPDIRAARAGADEAAKQLQTVTLGMKGRRLRRYSTATGHA